MTGIEMSMRTIAHDNVAEAAHVLQLVSLKSAVVVITLAMTVVGASVERLWAEVNDRPKQETQLERVSIDYVVSEWRQFETRIARVRVNFVESRVTMRNAYAEDAGRLGKSASPRLYPKEDTATRGSYSLLVDGPKIKLERRAQGIDVDGTKEQHEHYAFNSNVSKVFYDGARPFGVIQPDDDHGVSAFRDVAVIPVMLWLQPATTFDRAECVDVSISKAPGSDSYLRITGNTGHERAVAITFLVDPAADFRVCRHEVEHNGFVVHRDVIDYDRNSTNKLVPVRWKSELYHPGTNRLQLAIVCDVEESEINPSLSPDAFDLEFPENTFVTDMRDRTDYIQRPDGRRRVIQSTERGASRELLLRTESGKAAPVLAGSKTRLWMILGNLALVALIVGVICRKRFGGGTLFRLGDR